MALCVHITLLKVEYSMLHHMIKNYVPSVSFSFHKCNNISLHERDETTGVYLVRCPPKCVCVHVTYDL